MKKIVVLGSTGSIGRQTLEIIRCYPERFKLLGLGAGRNWRLLAEQLKEFRPSAAALAEERELLELKDSLDPSQCPDLAWGRKGMEDLAGLPEADLVVVAITGAAGIYPTLAAINAGKDVALANKETLVAAGQLVMSLARQKNILILPVDSEHSAVWQCLNGRKPDLIEKIILTASGGPFRQLTKEQLESVTVDMALHHPNWVMGSKITIDSATLMNKGLEVIEAKWLFGVNYSHIEVIVHPRALFTQLLSSGTAQYCPDGSTDMRLPIQYALTYPNRLSGPVPRLKWADLKGLTFEEPDLVKFPALGLAYEAGKAGGTMPAVLNAANEVAVELFLRGKISFTGIPVLVGGVMEQHKIINNPGLAEIMDADRWAREIALQSGV